MGAQFVGALAAPPARWIRVPASASHWPFFADFFCPEARLIVEIDGSQHADELARDKNRTEFLRNAGYDVLRFWNHEISSEIDSVVQRIVDALELSCGTRGKRV
jgi:very-short-patch-repair endonuclease